MDLLSFEFTKTEVIDIIISYYIQGYSIEDIRIKTNNEYDDEFINNIIDCYNYLNH